MPLLFLAFVLCDAQTMSREQRELRTAGQAILSTVAVLSSPQGRYLCAHNDLACVGPDKGELALALIGARRNSASSAALAAVLRFRIDAGLYEDYQCYVLKDGKSVRDYLIALKPVELQDECHLELNKLIRGKKSFEGLDQGSVCRDPGSIREEARALVEAIDHGRKCSSQDF
jgi:hypothetical protein